MRAILSDVQSNLEALESVLEEIDSRKISDVVCLGNLVGWGPNTKECLALGNERFRWCLSADLELKLVRFLSEDLKPEQVGDEPRPPVEEFFDWVVGQIGEAQIRFESGDFLGVVD